MSLASIPVPQVTRGGWHALDITPVLRELLLNAQGPAAELMLGVRFEAPKGKSISPEHFLHHPENNVTTNNVASPAFLVVFSEDSADNGLMDDGGEIHLQMARPHTHALAEMLQNVGGDFLRDVASVAKYLQPISETSFSINNRTRDDDFYLETSENGYRNKEIDSNLRHKHKSRVLKENNSNLYEKINSDEAENHRRDTPKNPLDGPKMIVFRRRRIHPKAKMHNPENKFGGNKPSSVEKKKKSYVAKTNEVELAEGNLSLRRLTRSILDNELPEESPHPTRSVPRTSPGSLLQGRKNGSTTSAKDDGNTIPLPPGGSFASNKRWKGGNRRRRGRGKKRGEHKKKSRKLSENWQHLEQVRLCLGHFAWLENQST
jgi:hypothetical protein